MLKKNLIILIAGFMLMLTGCTEQEQRWYEQDGLRSIVLVCFGLTSTATSPQTITYRDMADGTVKRTSSYVTTGSPCRGPSTHSDSTVYIKKCLQGQVYRPVQNDCRGAGTAPVWGAQTFQFCPTNDQACDMTATGNYGIVYVADPAKSPAAVSCANDTTVGKSWMLVREIGLYNINNLINSDGVIAFPDIPQGNTQLIWTDLAGDASSADSYYLDALQGAVNGAAELKSAVHYVLCATQSKL